MRGGNRCNLEHGCLVKLSSQSRAFVPRALQPAARSVYHGLFRLQLRARCWCADHSGAADVTGLPLPPALLRYRVSELLGRDEFLNIGEGCARLIEEHLGSMGVDLARTRRVLDFGCGCGRTLRWFLRECPDVEFHGADVDEEAIEWCRANLKSARFLRNDPLPPLPYPDLHFDVIYCLSVFTHLDEDMQDSWLAELSRLLAPGGVLLLTVHGDRAADALDPDGRATLQTSGFVHRRSRKLKGMVPDWYQTTWHSREYIERRLATWFDDIRYEALPGGMQAIVLARQKEF